MKRVKVIQYGGSIAEKILIRDSGEVLFVTTEEEWIASRRERREPITIGFRREYLILELPSVEGESV